MQRARGEQGKLQPVDLIFSFGDACEFSNETCTLLKHLGLGLRVD